MNELQAIMARRRRMIDDTAPKPEPDFDGDTSWLDLSNMEASATLGGLDDALFGDGPVVTAVEDDLLLGLSPPEHAATTTADHPLENKNTENVDGVIGSVSAQLMLPLDDKNSSSDFELVGGIANSDGDRLPSRRLPHTAGEDASTLNEEEKLTSQKSYFPGPDSAGEQNSAPVVEAAEQGDVSVADFVLRERLPTCPITETNTSTMTVVNDLFPASTYMAVSTTDMETIAHTVKRNLVQDVGDTCESGNAAVAECDVDDVAHATDRDATSVLPTRIEKVDDRPDSIETPNAKPAAKPPAPTVHCTATKIAPSMGFVDRDLAEIMERRRRIADGEQPVGQEIQRGVRRTRSNDHMLSQPSVAARPARGMTDKAMSHDFVESVAAAPVQRNDTPGSAARGMDRAESNKLVIKSAMSPGKNNDSRNAQEFVDDEKEDVQQPSLSTIDFDVTEELMGDSCLLHQYSVAEIDVQLGEPGERPLLSVSKEPNSMLNQKEKPSLSSIGFDIADKVLGDSALFHKSEVSGAAEGDLLLESSEDPNPQLSQEEIDHILHSSNISLDFATSWADTAEPTFSREEVASCRAGMSLGTLNSWNAAEVVAVQNAEDRINPIHVSPVKPRRRNRSTVPLEDLCVLTLGDEKLDHSANPELIAETIQVSPDFSEKPHGSEPSQAVANDKKLPEYEETSERLRDRSREKKSARTRRLKSHASMNDMGRIPESRTADDDAPIKSGDGRKRRQRGKKTIKKHESMANLLHSGETGNCVPNLPNTITDSGGGLTDKPKNQKPRTALPEDSPKKSSGDGRKRSNRGAKAAFRASLLHNMGCGESANSSKIPPADRPCNSDTDPDRDPKPKPENGLPPIDSLIPEKRGRQRSINIFGNDHQTLSEESLSNALSNALSENSVDGPELRGSKGFGGQASNSGMQDKQRNSGPTQTRKEKEKAVGNSVSRPSSDALVQGRRKRHVSSEPRGGGHSNRNPTQRSEDKNKNKSGKRRQKRRGSTGSTRGEGALTNSPIKTPLDFLKEKVPAKRELGSHPIAHRDEPRQQRRGSTGSTGIKGNSFEKSVDIAAVRVNSRKSRGLASHSGELGKKDSSSGKPRKSSRTQGKENGARISRKASNRSLDLSMELAKVSHDTGTSEYKKRSAGGEDHLETSFESLTSSLVSSVDAFADVPLDHANSPRYTSFGASPSKTGDVLRRDTLPILTLDAVFPAERPSDFDGFGDQDEFDPSSFFDAPTQWDKSPLTDVPKSSPKKLSLVPREALLEEFLATPISNPLNGNVIFCSKSRESPRLHEVDPSCNFRSVSNFQVLSSDVQEQIALKYNATVHSVDSIWKLAAGAHHSNGRTYVSVAAVIDLCVIESNLKMRVVLVWRWEPGVVSLQDVITPPAGADFIYDSTTLQVADGLLFLAGSSPDGACIFVARLDGKDQWWVNYIEGSGNVTSMATAPTSNNNCVCPYLVIAQTDNSLSVWTYRSAIRNGEPKRCLFALSRLQYTAVLSVVEPTSLEKEHVGVDVQGIGYCTHLSWLPSHSPLSSLLMFAAAFENGLAVFHVDLPMTESGNGEAELNPLAPLVAKRWRGKHECSYVSWLSLGPHVDPCISIVLKGAERALVVVGMMDLSVYTIAAGQAALAPFRILACASASKASGAFPAGILQGNLRSVVCYSETKVLTFSFSSSLTKITNTPLVALGHAISSCPPGLTSSGDKSSDTILHIFSTLQYGASLEWTRPARRYWLCSSKTDDYNDMEESTRTAAASSEILCELDEDSLIGLRPCRLVRCGDSSICAVVYRAAFGSLTNSFKSMLLVDATTIALVHHREFPSIETLKGRDIAFLPCDKQDAVRGILLSHDGSSMSFFSLNGTGSFTEHTAHRPIVGIDGGKQYVDCRRVLLFSDLSLEKVKLAVLGKRRRDNRVCFVTGDLCDLSDATVEGWSLLLPNIATGRVLWLESDEEVFSCVGLQSGDNASCNFALRTTKRVMILSSSLDVMAESSVDMSSDSIAPLGSYAVCYITKNALHYLCCLDGHFQHGVIASVAQSDCGCPHSSLLAVRQDRFLLFGAQSIVHHVDYGGNKDSFLFPQAITRPSMMLEPMIANAICVAGKMDRSSPTLRTVIERFGRKVATLTHGDNEGIGSQGVGISAKIFEMLAHYGLKHANSWLLTGTVEFKRLASTSILPRWIPVGPKSAGTLNADVFLHVVASGDSHLTEYLKSPEFNMPSTLPKKTGSSAYACSEYAEKALRNGKALDALKILDVVGTESSDSLILHLSLILEMAKANSALGVLNSLSGNDNNSFSRSAALVTAPASLSALALSLNTRSGETSPVVMKGENIDRWIKPLAPSLQQRPKSGRIRTQILSEKALESVGVGANDGCESDLLWSSPCREAKHVWNEGPGTQKEHLLMLDSVEDWLGRKRPVILGREGADAAKDRGEKTLADILNSDDDSFGREEEDLKSAREDGWVEGVGEGRSDEANISGYFRMSEGDEEDSVWRTKGFLDLSTYRNKAFIIGDPDSFSLQQSTSCVDEGEPGKVKSLFDLVFEKSGVNLASGLSVRASRGGSLDIGVLHTSSRTARKKCSLEFWYYMPRSDSTANEIILARRTIGSCADDLSKVGLASDKESVLWELVSRTSGSLEFRTCGGSELSSSKGAPRKSATGDDDSDDEKERLDLVSFERWNHVCLVLSSKGLKASECSVAIYMKGIEVVSGIASMMPPTFTESDLSGDTKLAGIMQKSHLLFGLNHSAGFRITELRVWACERSAGDTQSFMYEYLNAAEQKKKFRVKITNKSKKIALAGMGAGLAPPKDAPGTARKGVLEPPRRSLLVPLPSPMKSPGGLRSSVIPVMLPMRDAKSSLESQLDITGLPQPPDIHNTHSVLGSEEFGFGSTQDAPDGSIVHTQEVYETLRDSFKPLSQKMKPSAANALIRGPPCARHFGGNRGGLPDHLGHHRLGVGGVAACGSEKTVVWRDSEHTYPIGASGAIVSDLMDDESNEFLCCFMAKEKRIVVFELRSRTLVAELQMVTKLHFWRYLPPEAAENALCFLIVTPVGGFHWMPLEDAPPRLVWKRGQEFQGMKIVSYEEGGSNGLVGADILSRVGLVIAVRSQGDDLTAQTWLMPVRGDSQPVPVSDEVMGACLCHPYEGPALPLLITVHEMETEICVHVLSITEPSKGSLALGDVQAIEIIDMTEYECIDFTPPDMTMGTAPEAICVCIANIVVIIIRRKGLVIAFEIEDETLHLIAQKTVDHYVIDAVMRYSSNESGREILLLLSDDDNPRDGRAVSFCFREVFD